MLAQTIRKNMTTKIDGSSTRNKTTKFSSLFQTAPTVKDKDEGMVKVLMKAGLMKVAQDDAILDEVSVPQIFDTEETDDFIVENPDEVVVSFPLKPVIELDEKLPFFKSITKKLECIYCNIESIHA